MPFLRSQATKEQGHALASMVFFAARYEMATKGKAATYHGTLRAVRQRLRAKVNESENAADEQQSSCCCRRPGVERESPATWMAAIA